MITKACYHDTLVSILWYNVYFFFIYIKTKVCLQNHICLWFLRTFWKRESLSLQTSVKVSKTQQCWECCGNIAYMLHKLSRIHTRGCYDLHYSRGAQVGCYSSYRATGLGKMALRKLANSILQLESDYILNDLWKPRCIVFFFKNKN